MGSHLSDEQLARYQDGDLSRGEVAHLNACPDCAGRLHDLRGATAAYLEYRDIVRGPSQPPVPQPWRSLDALIVDAEAEGQSAAPDVGQPPRIVPFSPGFVARPDGTDGDVSGPPAFRPAAAVSLPIGDFGVERSRRTWRWWLVPALAAAACVVIAAGMFLRQPIEQASIQVSELLARSVRAERPSSRMISMRLRGRTLLRPAVLITGQAINGNPDTAHLEAVFTAAHYSWREPLSARSFQSWRNGLTERRDSVSVIQAAGQEPAYRVRTDTDGVLRSASLTLRGKDLRPTDGAFQFDGEDLLEIDDAIPPAPIAAKPAPAAQEATPVETPATPADSLHVLAALNQIGADVGEPIDVSEDPRHHVVVRAIGLSADRKQQVVDVLHALPHVKLDLDADPSDAHLTVTLPGTPERNANSIPGPLRQRFETRVGGAVAFQEMTDRVLEASGAAVARAHAIEVLARKFAPQTEASLSARDRELLGKLRQRHTSELQHLAARIRTDLKPLLPASIRSASTATAESSAAAQWQSRVPVLVDGAQKLDDSLNRLLAGSYSQSAGETILHSVAEQLDRLERTIQSRPEGGR